MRLYALMLFVLVRFARLDQVLHLGHAAVFVFFLGGRGLGHIDQALLVHRQDGRAVEAMMLIDVRVSIGSTC